MKETKSEQICKPFSLKSHYNKPHPPNKDLGFHFKLQSLKLYQNPNMQNTVKESLSSKNRNMQKIKNNRKPR